jgi:hypothetical protein
MPTSEGLPVRHDTVSDSQDSFIVQIKDDLQYKEQSYRFKAPSQYIGKSLTSH